LPVAAGRRALEHIGRKGTLVSRRRRTPLISNLVLKAKGIFKARHPRSSGAFQHAIERGMAHVGPAGWRPANLAPNRLAPRRSERRGFGSRRLVRLRVHPRSVAVVEIGGRSSTCLAYPSPRQRGASGRPQQQQGQDNEPARRRMATVRQRRETLEEEVQDPFHGSAHAATVEESAADSGAVWAEQRACACWRSAAGSLYGADAALRWGELDLCVSPSRDALLWWKVKGRRRCGADGWGVAGPGPRKAKAGWPRLRLWLAAPVTARHETSKWCSPWCPATGARSGGAGCGGSMVVERPGGTLGGVARLAAMTFAAHRARSVRQHA